MAQEKHLKLFGIADNLSERRHTVLRSVVKLIGAVCDRTCHETVRIDRVPIDEQINDRAVIMAQYLRQLGDLSISQAIVRESIHKEYKQKRGES